MSLESVLRLMSPDDTWVICGKGPSLDVAALAKPPSTVRLLGIGSVGSVLPTSLNLFNDVEAMLKHPHGNICMPWRPNIKFRPGLTLPELVAKYPAFASAVQDGRLYGYRRAETDNTGAPADWPEVSCVYFSGEAAVGICLAAGIRPIFTSGIDGGTQYHPVFDTSVRLNNGQTTFTKSTPRIVRMCMKARTAWIRGLPLAFNQCPAPCG